MVVFLSEAEHIILADWLGVEPHCQTSDLLSSDALEILGFSGRANGAVRRMRTRLSLPIYRVVYAA